MVKFLTFSIFTTPGSQTPSPLYLYIVKIEDFHQILTAFLMKQENILVPIIAKKKLEKTFSFSFFDEDIPW